MFPHMIGFESVILNKSENGGFIATFEWPDGHFGFIKLMIEVNRPKPRVYCMEHRR